VFWKCQVQPFKFWQFQILIVADLADQKCCLLVSSAFVPSELPQVGTFEGGGKDECRVELTLKVVSRAI